MAEQELKILRAWKTLCGACGGDAKSVGWVCTLGRTWGAGPCLVQAPKGTAGRRLNFFCCANW